jgi:transcriptional regulator with XRE-family HTH domain
MSIERQRLLEHEAWITSTRGKHLPVTAEDRHQSRKEFEGLEGIALREARLLRRAEQLRAMRIRARENRAKSPYQRVMALLAEGFSLQEVAERTGVVVQQVGRWAKGLPAQPALRKVVSEKAKNPENF